MKIFGDTELEIPEYSNMDISPPAQIDCLLQNQIQSTSMAKSAPTPWTLVPAAPGLQSFDLDLRLPDHALPMKLKAADGGHCAMKHVKAVIIDRPVAGVSNQEGSDATKIPASTPKVAVLHLALQPLHQLKFL